MNIALLRLISISYLLTPNLIFVAFWFRPLVAIPVVAGLLGLFIWNARGHEPDHSRSLNLRDFIFVLLFAFFWTAFIGIGDVFPQTADMWIHDSKFYDLAVNPWPTFFPEKGQYACYYFGYFLVPGLISRLAGEVSVPAIFIWTWAGFALGAAWVYLLVNKNKFLLLVLPFLGGIFLFPLRMINLLFDVFKELPYYFTMWSLFDQSAWVPNQVIPTLIVSGIIAYDAIFKDKAKDSFFAITLTFVWAIFPSIIMVLQLGIIVLFQRFKGIFEKESWISIILPGVLFIPSFLYLTSSDSLPLKGFVWEFFTPGEILNAYLSGIILEVLMIVVLLIVLRKFMKPFPFWLAWGVSLLLLPFAIYRLGVGNDGLQRGSIPVLITVSILILSTASNALAYAKQTRAPWKYALLFTLALAFTAPLLGMTRIRNPFIENKILSRFMPGYGIHYQSGPYDAFPNTYQTLRARASENDALQYLGKKGSFYEKYLSSRRE